MHHLTFQKVALHFTLAFFLVCTWSCTTSPKAASTAKKNYTPINTSKESLLTIPYRSLSLSKEIHTFAIGSCVHQKLAQPIWTTVQKNNPELFIMMGDNVYASSPQDRPLIDQYIKLNENQDYKQLRESTPFLATWDDHDYGQNDGGVHNPEKEEARRVFVNYWGYLVQSLPKGQKAIYHSRTVGSKNKKIQFILLDTRWDRSELTKNPEYDPTDKTNPQPKIYLPNSDKAARILSDEQWKWFENELKKPAQIRFIVSSIQVIPNDHSFEKWGNFPLERERFFNLLKKYKIRNAIILSGDRHLSVISKTDLKGLGSIYEITASSLNRPSPAIDKEQDSTYISEPFLKSNFGLISINWPNKTVQARIIDENNITQIDQIIKF